MPFFLTIFCTVIYFSLSLLLQLTVGFLSVFSYQKEHSQVFWNKRPKGPYIVYLSTIIQLFGPKNRNFVETLNTVEFSEIPFRDCMEF